MRIRGSCHCRNVSFTLDWTPEPAEIPARACSCTFCTKHGAVWTACPTASLVVAIGDPALTSAYRFGTGTADFHVCTRCGVAPVATSVIDGRVFAVVNVSTFDGVDAALLRKTIAVLDGESEPDRLARRSRNWIGDVALVRGA